MLRSCGAAVVGLTLLGPLFPINKIDIVEQQVWVAHASRVLASASSRVQTFSVNSHSLFRTKFQERLFRRDAETSPRDARATQLKFAQDHGNSSDPWHDFTSIKAKPFSPPTDSRSRVAELLARRRKRTSLVLSTSTSSSPKRGLPPVRPEQKMHSNELEGKPILREPRRVKKTISYQYQRLKFNGPTGRRYAIRDPARHGPFASSLQRCHRRGGRGHPDGIRSLARSRSWGLGLCG